ncbi:unnamed protein product [Pleuronectes platessa]|uniref:Fibrinogen C-terminal domain-containing protein n=1 Tax=Pleuronectes platessa TaxID=8262 RepID=A0A9N7VBB0_PLEPL|nr:unnamed protein product [Pleuronectes platessa]
MSVFLLLALVLNTASSAQLSTDWCGPEVTALKRSIKRLENSLLIVTWQVEHLQTHKYFLPFRPALPDAGAEADKASGANHNGSATLDSSNTTLMKPLPSAGNIIVHDRDCSELMEEDGQCFRDAGTGRVDFNRDWVDYRDGFGDFKLWNDEFWLGNEHMHSLLSEGKNLVKIDLMDWEGQRSHSYYENFRISDEADKYRLHYGQYSGKAGDALTGGGGAVQQWSACLSGMQFSTRDQDNDRYLQGSCAQENEAGWWFNRCHAANLNGKFYRSGKYKNQHDNGVVWGTWKGLWYSLRHTTMKVRPLVFLDMDGSGAGDI